MGSRATVIQNALDKLCAIARVVQTSFLYESPPMYFVDQPPFLNAVCEVDTDLEPVDLLRAIKIIERDLGRDLRSPRNGPRPIDLDIITYGERAIHEPHCDLTIPHPRLHEREFVLRPIFDISPSLSIPQTNGGTKPVSTLLDDLVAKDGDGGLIKVTPTSTGKLLRWGQRVLLMGIINATPDSFSDGGKHNTVEAALAQAEKFTKFGFDVLDVSYFLFIISSPSVSAC